MELEGRARRAVSGAGYFERGGHCFLGRADGVGAGAIMLLVLPFAWWRGEGPLIAAAVGISLLAITTLAATAGAALPLLFDRMGLDPALMSAPFITTATDIAGVLIYLQTASWLLVHMDPSML